MGEFVGRGGFAAGDGESAEAITTADASVAYPRAVTAGPERISTLQVSTDISTPRRLREDGLDG